MDIKQISIMGQLQVELQTVEIDLELGPDEVLIETEYSFISAGTELANYSGKEPAVFIPGSWCAYPSAHRIIGSCLLYEFYARISAKNEALKRLKW